jgi:hypothetical protein
VGVVENFGDTGKKQKSIDFLMNRITLRACHDL